MSAALLVFSTAAVAQTVAITGGRVYPVSGAPIENGTVLIRDGKIVSVGANVAVPANAQRIDAVGKWVTPGLINSSTQLGLVEVGQVQSTRDDAAKGKNNIAAAFRVWEGLNTNSVMIAPTRRDGVTSVVVVPTGDQLVSGQAAILNLVDGMPGDMVLKTPVAMVAQVQNPQDAGTGARGELLVRLRELIEDTRAFMKNRAAFERAQTRNYIASRLDLEAMIPVVEGRLALLVSADKATDIDAAMRIAKENGLKIMIGGGAEAWLVADKLAAARIPVLTGAMNNIPSSFSQLATAQENAGLLRKAGVQVIVIGNAGGGDEETFNVRNIRQEAGNAVSYGMTWEDALIWSGDPFEFTSVAEHVFVRGHEYTAPDRQQLLTEKYRKLPPDQGMPIKH